MGKGAMIKKYLRICGPEEALRLMQRLIGHDGGPGSGNFGHKGRPGKVGGSGGGGGSAFRTTTSGGAYVGVQKAAAFNGIKKVAQKSKDAHDFIDSLDKDQRDMVAAQYRQSGSKEGIMNYSERLRQLMCSQKPEKSVPYKMVDGKDLSDSAKWDGEAYTEPTYGQVIDTEIEHVIVQQGFNGPPKVVSQAEFMDHVAKHPQMPVLFRSYSGLGEEQVQSYDDMLEGGEWYIDCSNGGAQYGQGMYCAGVYDHKGGTEFRGVASEMEHYRHVSAKNIQKRWVPDLKEGEDCFWQDGKQVIYRQDEMKRTEDEKPPEAQDVVAMVKNGWRTETVKGYFMPADASDPDSPLEFTYYSDIDGHQTVKAEQVPWWGPYKSIETPPAPKVSTRMMTLDPSAKIITYSEALDLYSGKLTEKMKSDFYRGKLAGTESELKESSMSDDEVAYFSYSYKASTKLGGINMEDWKKVGAGLSDERKEELKQKALEKAQEHFLEMDSQRDERRKKAHSYGDIGAYMASLGYDAVNAEGHGDTGSYTIVLNRTKLIINQSRVDMAS